MTKEYYFNHYSNDFNEIVKEYIAIEGNRLAKVMKESDHITMRENRFAIERLEKAKMLIEGQTLIPNT